MSGNIKFKNINLKWTLSARSLLIFICLLIIHIRGALLLSFDFSLARRIEPRRLSKFEKLSPWEYKSRSVSGRRKLETKMRFS